MKHVVLALAISLTAMAAQAECIIPEPTNFASRSNCADDVKEYLARVGGCWKAGDEKTESPERRAIIKANLCDLRCGTLVKDGKDLQAKYAQDADNVAVMNEFIGKREVKDYNTLNCKRVIKQR